ncbi:glycoside hydrolase family 65 protein [Nannocystis bainbridge]|uniref:Glycosyl hydrolase family 65 protein n=1 Tax=Nannocystis bainbridge TaxID=2995303 RepID=A0ABT5DV46_9BACT|nr:glycosyl hydrolase family 65 protein [Nannocystis bainbridge]MDC0716934.1 glycosyl hydrolase family 65 protein [Nannocystis bainbridge]
MSPHERDGARLAPWSIVYESFEREREGQREVLCALGNGHFVTRAAAPWAVAGESHYPGTYRAGLYNHKTSVVDGEPLAHEGLVNLPNWLRIDVGLGDGDWFSPERVTVREYRQELDLRRGLLVRTIRFEVDGLRATLHEQRLVHLGMPHLAAQQLRLELAGAGARVRLRSWLDGQVTNANAEEYRGADGEHLEQFEVAAPGAGVLTLRARTCGSRLEFAVATRTRVLVEGGEVEPLAPLADGARRVGLHTCAALETGGSVTLEKIAALYARHDRTIREPLDAAASAVAGAPDFAALLPAHTRAWAELWDRFDVEVEDEQSTTTTLRLHLFHILQTVSPHTIGLDAGIPGRGWHGEGYRGHVFWDELFVFPVLAYRLPELARSLLLYRFRRLPAARAAARAAGLRGAMFPWRSASDGREVSEPRRKNTRSGRWIADNSRLQRHIGAAVAYNVWHYYEITGDREFMAEHGAEMLVEVARFWASAAQFEPARERYVIRGVGGPDEFHDAYPEAARPGVDNNAYTNVMAVWTLLRAREALALLPEGARQLLVDRLGLGADELRTWEDITRRMFVPFHGEGLISQFEGYERLAEFDWDLYRARYRDDIHRLDNILEAEGDTANRYKVSKQADVLMLFYLLAPEELRAIFTGLGYAWDDAMLAVNARYYLRRTSHGSTLSRVVHAWVLARCDPAHSWQMLREALGSDLGDIQGGTTEEGVHLGAMAGTIDIFQRCYTGLEARDGALWLRPALPDELKSVSFRVRHRCAWVSLTVRNDGVTVQVDDDAEHPVTVRIDGQAETVQPGARRTFAVAPASARKLGECLEAR